MKFEFLGLENVVGDFLTCLHTLSLEIMHTTRYSGLENLITTFLQTVDLEKNDKISTNILTIQDDVVDHPPDVDAAVDADVGIHTAPVFKLDYQLITPRLWNCVISNTNMMIVYNHDLYKVYELIEKTIKKTKQDKDKSVLVDTQFFIINGLITAITVIFSKFIEIQRINYNSLNFRILYLIFFKLQQLDKLIDYKVQINESSEIWDIVDKIYIPCGPQSDYESLVDYLSNHEVEDDDGNGVLGADSFVNLSKLLQRFKVGNKL